MEPTANPLETNRDVVDHIMSYVAPEELATVRAVCRLWRDSARVNVPAELNLQSYDYRRFRSIVDSGQSIGYLRVGFMPQEDLPLLNTQKLHSLWIGPNVNDQLRGRLLDSPRPQRKLIIGPSSIEIPTIAQENLVGIQSVTHLELEGSNSLMRSVLSKGLSQVKKCALILINEGLDGIEQESIRAVTEMEQLEKLYVRELRGPQLFRPQPREEEMNAQNLQLAYPITPRTAVNITHLTITALEHSLPSWLQLLNQQQHLQVISIANLVRLSSLGGLFHRSANSIHTMRLRLDTARSRDHFDGALFTNMISLQHLNIGTWRRGARPNPARNISLLPQSLLILRVVAFNFQQPDLIRFFGNHPLIQRIQLVNKTLPFNNEVVTSMMARHAQRPFLYSLYPVVDQPPGELILENLGLQFRNHVENDDDLPVYDWFLRTFDIMGAAATRR